MRNQFMMIAVLLAGLVTTAAEEQTYARYVKTDECQRPPLLLPHRTVEDLRMMGYKAWETNGQVYYCDTDKPIPIEPLCKFKVTENHVSYELVIKPKPIVERDEIKWLFEIQKNGFVFSVNTVKAFSHMIYTINEQRSERVMHSSTGSSYNYYSNKVGRDFESKNVLDRTTYTMTCNFYDIAPTTGQR